MSEQPARYMLFVTSRSANSLAARSNLDRALAALGRSTKEVTIVDVNDRADLAVKYGIFATPALVITSDPKFRIVGDLSFASALMNFLQ